VAVSGAASRQHGVVVSDDAADADLVTVKEAHGRCGEDCTGRPSTPRRYGEQWLPRLLCGVRWDLNGHANANARSRLTAFIPSALHLRASFSCRRSLARPKAPSPGAAPLLPRPRPQPQRRPRFEWWAWYFVQWYLPTYCACTCRRAPADIHPPRPQRLMKQEEGGAVATTCDAAEQPVDTAF
jgi:hypothetical protein